MNAIPSTGGRRVGRTPPMAEAEERALVGSVLLEPDVFARVADRVTSSDFYRREYAELWRIFGEMHRAGTPIDTVTVQSRLEASGKLASVGGVEMLLELPSVLPTTHFAESYADAVAEKGAQRRLAATLQAQAARCLDPEADVDVLIEEALQGVTTIREGRNIEPPPTFDRISREARVVDATWFDAAPPPRSWLLEQADPEFEGARLRGWLPRGKVGMLAAAGGVGKTMVLVYLAISVVTGRDWFGMTVGARGRVLLALAEEDVEEAHRRIYAAASQLRLNAAEVAALLDLLVVVPLAGTPVALLERDQAGNAVHSAALADLWRVLNGADNWALVVLDPLARWAGIDVETDNALATRFVEAVETLVRAPGGPTVLLAHHTSKSARRDGDGSANAARGASALTDGVRWVATMAPGTVGQLRTVKLEVVKSNYSHPGEPVTLVRETDGGLRLLDSGELAEERDRAEGRAQDALEVRVLELLASGQYTSEAAIRSAMGAKMGSIQTVLARLKATGRVIKAGKAAPFEVVR